MSTQEIVLVQFSTPRVSISFNYSGKDINFLRNVTDDLATVLKRMQMSCLKSKSQGQTAKKKPRPSGPDDAETILIYFADDEGNINHAYLNQPIEYVLKTAKYLFIEELRYRLLINPSRVKCLSVHTPMLSDHPVFLKVELENGEIQDFTAEWSLDDGSCSSAGLCFIPPRDALGHYVKVKCFHPKYPELFQQFQTTEKVICSSELSAPFSFHFPLSDTIGSNLRVATFNILAQGYAVTELGKGVLYSHIKNDLHMASTYRMSLVTREILYCNSDILCLQEVAPAALENFLVPLFGNSAKIYYIFKDRSTTVNGVCTIVKNSRMQVLDVKNVLLGGDSLLSYFSEDDRCTLRNSFGEHFMDVVVPKLNTVANIVVTESKNTGKILITANTHLFYHPLCAHVRLLQVIALVRELERFKAARFPTAGVIITGDLNSSPGTGVFAFLSKGRIEIDASDWCHGDLFKWHQETQDDDEGSIDSDASDVSCDSPTVSCTGIEANHGLNLQCSFSALPELTHAVAAFRGVLDYVFFSRDSLHLSEDSCKRFIGISKVVDGFGGFPCESYGSDHVLVSAELSEILE